MQKVLIHFTVLCHSDLMGRWLTRVADTDIVE